MTDFFIIYFICAAYTTFFNIVVMAESESRYAIKIRQNILVLSLFWPVVWISLSISLIKGIYRKFKGAQNV